MRVVAEAGAGAEVEEAAAVEADTAEGAMAVDDDRPLHRFLYLRFSFMHKLFIHFSIQICFASKIGWQ